MKLILRADVDNLGRLGEEVIVKAGYGRNYLIPQGMAMLATKANLKSFEMERKKLETKMEGIRKEAMDFGEKIAAQELVIEVRVGEGDKLYGSVTRSNIADALREALGADGDKVDRKKMLLEEPIRALGEYAIPVKLHQDVVVDLKVIVSRIGGPIEEEVAEEAEAPAEAEAVEASEEAAE